MRFIEEQTNSYHFYCRSPLAGMLRWDLVSPSHYKDSPEPVRT